MYDVNNHPKQEELNRQIANTLANTVSSLKAISNVYDVDARDLAEQFKKSFELFANQEGDI